MRRHRHGGSVRPILPVALLRFNRMPEPSVHDLPPQLARLARAVARPLKSAGYDAWLVGGAVRDLALGRAAHDVDMVSAATPDVVEGLFEATIPVGRAFGTVLVRVDGDEVQLTTFRAESGYSDKRRPDEVVFGTSLEVDSARRDFTCNALYLDPLTDELRDPRGGLADLDRQVLRTVGDPRARFAEDGLRLLRMVRFEAALGFEPAPGLHEAAEAEAESLSGVSPERVLVELIKLFEGPRSAKAFAALIQTGLLERALLESPADRDWSRWLAVHERLPDPPGALRGLACWLLGDLDPASPESVDARAAERAAALRVSRATARGLEDIWRLGRHARALAGGTPARSALVRAAREPHWTDALDLANAREPERADAWGHLRDATASLSVGELHPAPWIESSDLEAAGVPRGPLWGQLLRESETEQLDGRLPSREEALAWLERRARELQGGAA